MEKHEIGTFSYLLLFTVIILPSGNKARPLCFNTFFFLSILSGLKHNTFGFEDIILLSTTYIGVQNCVLNG